jgi:hypothetical protein
MYSDNLTPELLNTAHSFIQDVLATARLTLERSGNIIPVPKTSAVLGT